MNATYHIEAPTREDFDRILNQMIEDEDPALMCANVVWRKTEEKSDADGLCRND